MSFLILSLLCLVVGLIWTYLKNLYSYWERRGIPNEKPVFLLGNLKGIGDTVHFRDINQRIYERFKGTAPFAGLYFFVQKAVFLMDMDLIKCVLIKDSTNFRDRGFFHNSQDDPLSGNLFGLDGEEWRAMRTKLTPVFTSGKMKHMFPTVVKVAENMLPVCRQLAKDSVEGAIEIKDLSARFTTDVIGTCAFGIECNSLEDPNSEFLRRGRAVFAVNRHPVIVQAFTIAYPQLAQKLHMKFFTDETIEFYLGIVRSTIDYRLKSNVKRNDFMDLLIEMKAHDEEAARQGKGIDLSHGLTLEQIAAQVFLFFLAGFDTSSTTMSFCLYELALNQDIQDKVRAEVQGILKAHNGELTYESLNEMPYLEQVIAETLRKYPVLPHVTRKALKDYAVEGTNHIIEAGSNIIIPINAIHHDPKFYPNPEKFDPARFEHEAMEQRPAMSYLPFGDGPRNCIGLRFGKMQAKIGLATFLKNFKLTPTKRTEMPLLLEMKSFAIAPRNGIYVHVESI